MFFFFQDHEQINSSVSELLPGIGYNQCNLSYFVISVQNKSTVMLKMESVRVRDENNFLNVLFNILAES